MKKVFLTLVMFLGAILFVVQGSAQATWILFSDHTIYWGSSQSWTDSEKWTNANGTGDDKVDSIGFPSFPDPNLTAGTYELGIALNSQLITVGFAPNCANDVILEAVSVPEPMPLLLLGFSLLGLGITSGKKFLAKR